MTRRISFHQDGAWLRSLQKLRVLQPKPYVLRHTFATWALEAGFDLFELARPMGTSAAMIDRTYGHLARGHAERARDRLNRRPSIVVAEAVERGER
jgi:integrase